MNDPRSISRRAALPRAAALAGALAISARNATLLAAPSPPRHRFQIGACDWSLGHRQDIAAIALARRLGLDGVQVSFDDPDAPHDLRLESVRQAYDKACAKHGIAIASLAMGVLNRVPYASDPRAERWVRECVDVLPHFENRIVLLAFFGQGDIKEKPELQREVVRRLKRVAPAAEKAGAILGLETWLSADEHLAIIDAVESPAVRVYYDVANSHRMGYDIYREIRRLGAARICQIHCKENESLLGHGRINYRRVKEALEEIEYRGWLVIEGAVGPGLSIEESYRHNQEFLRGVFNP